jgi:hypothetical protein
MPPGNRSSARLGLKRIAPFLREAHHCARYLNQGEDERTCERIENVVVTGDDLSRQLEHPGRVSRPWISKRCQPVRSKGGRSPIPARSSLGRSTAMLGVETGACFGIRRQCQF